MEKYIDLINGYLNNTLSEDERQNFENRLETDSEFKQLYNEQIVILEGINRVGLKAEINAVKQSYVRGKWMKYLGISVGVVLVSVVIFSLVFKTKITKNTEQINNQIEAVTDVETVEKSSKKLIEDPKELKEVIEIDDEIATSRKATRNDVSIEEVVNKEAVSKEKSLVKIDEVSQKTKPEPMATELKAFFKLNKKQPQRIEVNTEKEFTVTCKEGTILTIPAKSFVDANTGKLARGKINLEVTEYYKLSDMLLANLTTKADGKQLETGGMLYLDANKKDEKLKLKPGRKIQIVFNNKGKKRMQLFSGEENSEGVNWKLQTEKNGSIEEDVEVDFSTIEIVPTYPGCENLSNNDKRKCMNDAINKIVSRKFDMEIAENLGLKGKHKIVIDFRIDKKGNVGEVNARASRKEVADEAVRVIEFLPQFIPGKQRGKPVRTRYSLVFNIQLEGKNTESSSVVFVKSDKNFIETFEKRLDSIESSNGILGTISNDHIARYAFATTKLGWINCDRFVNSKKQKVKFKLKIKDPNGTNVKMVFKSMSSILPSKKFADEFDFGLLPIDEEVIVIAIKKTKDKLYLAKKEMQTKRNPDLKLDFKEVTIQELKMELENLNSSF